MPPFIPDGAVLARQAFGELLERVPRVMLVPHQSRIYLPSAVRRLPELAATPAPLWVPAAAGDLRAALTEEEKALPIEARFSSNTANVDIRLLEPGVPLAFLVTQDAAPLFEDWRRRHP